MPTITQLKAALKTAQEAEAAYAEVQKNDPGLAAFKAEGEELSRQFEDLSKRRTAYVEQTHGEKKRELSAAVAAAREALVKRQQPPDVPAPLSGIIKAMNDRQGTSQAIGTAQIFEHSPDFLRAIIKIPAIPNFSTSRYYLCDFSKWGSLKQSEKREAWERAPVRVDLPNPGRLDARKLAVWRFYLTEGRLPGSPS